LVPDRKNIILYNPSDDLINNFNNCLWVPDANIGVYYSNPRMYGGLSVSDLFQACFKFGREGYDDYRPLRHY
jgi:hypothetical protein